MTSSITLIQSASTWERLSVYDEFAYKTIKRENMEIEVIFTRTTIREMIL